MSILQEILIHKKEELRLKKNSLPLKEIKARLKDTPPPKNFRTALKRDTGEPIKLVAEIKKASPSTGVIRPNFNPSEIVSLYEKKRCQRNISADR